MAGPTIGDAFWAPPPSSAFGDGWTRSPGRLRIGYNAHAADPAIAVDKAWGDAVADAAQVLEGLGHMVEEVDLPGFVSGDDTMIPDLAMLMAVPLAARDDLPPEESLTPWSRSLIELGRQASGTQVMAAQERVIRACRHVVQFFERYDLLLTPTVAQPPPMVGEFADLNMDSVMQLWSYSPFTGLWNTTGQPAVSIPWGVDHRQLPVAVQLIGRPTDELTLLQISGQIEAAHPWSGLRPPTAELRN
jgi:amidase